MMGKMGGELLRQNDNLPYMPMLYILCPHSLLHVICIRLAQLSRDHGWTPPYEHVLECQAID
jgi:hypothetical protein